MEKIEATPQIRSEQFIESVKENPRQWEMVHGLLCGLNTDIDNAGWYETNQTLRSIYCSSTLAKWLDDNR